MWSPSKLHPLTTSAYTDSQVDRYLSHILLPVHYYHSAHPAKDIHFLNALRTHQLFSRPYEDLSIHYSKAHRVSLDPQTIYEKIMRGNGREGYCMENTIFFNHILRALGFQVCR